MPRPRNCRRVSAHPAVVLFKPAGIPRHALEELQLTLDEFEAVRLSDLEGLYQEEACAKLGVSRATFGRIVSAARNKIAQALVYGKALRIEGGPIHLSGHGCSRCRRGAREQESIVRSDHDDASSSVGNTDQGERK